MSVKLRFVWAATLSCGLVFLQTPGIGQQSSAPSLKQGLKRTALEEQSERQRLQAQAKQILAAEMARENAKVCPNANTTYDFNVCFGKEVAITDASLKAFEAVIVKLGDPDPGAPNHPATVGIAGPSLSPKQQIAEFHAVEQSWRRYRDNACRAAFHQFDGGTGGPSFELECELRLDRSHMRELDMIYGEDLHL